MDEIQHTFKRQKRNLLIGMGVFAVVIIASFFIFRPNNDGTEYNNDDAYNPDDIYSWENDNRRLTYLDTVSNLTLQIDYGNGTIRELTNVTLTDHYTSAFDLLAKNAEIKYTIYRFGNTADFYITEIDGIHEDVSAGIYWQIWVNGIYLQASSNSYQLHDNDVVGWKYGSEIVNE